MAIEPRTAPPQRELVASISPERKADLVAGAGTWWTHGATELGLAPLKLSDGPNGVRGETFDERDVALCTPCGTALAASWDPDLVRRVGALVGDDARRQGVHVVLGPTMNIHRSPLGGRGFECYSEDPLLSGTIGAAWIRGVQSRGVAATPKHFVCNDAETHRTTVDCVVGARALRELYLVPFELATAAGAWALMTAYNRVNGVYCAASEALVTRILKREWRWDGVVVSDWFAPGDTVGFANGGLDLEMPGPARLFGPALADAVREGLVDEATVDDKVARLLTLAARVGRRDGTAVPAPESADDVLTEAAAGGFVLLKNDARLLPLAAERPRRIAVVGPNADDPCYQGGGSAHVAVGPVPTPLAAIRERFGDTAEIVHEPGCTQRRTLPGLHLLDVRAAHDSGSRGITVEYFGAGALRDEASAREVRNASTLIWLHDAPGVAVEPGGLVRVSTLLRPAEAGPHLFSVRGSGDCRVLVSGREVAAFSPGPREEGPGASLFSHRDARGEATLRTGEEVLVEIELRPTDNPVNLLSFGCRPAEPPDLIERAVRAATEADAVVLVVGTSEEVESESFDRTTTALPGEQETLIRRVLAANWSTVVVVNAGTAVDPAWAGEAATVLYSWFPGQAFGPALAGVLAGDREPGGRLPITIGRHHEDYPAWDTTPDADNRLAYAESVFVGYRHFDAAGIEPEFCFGHGLGYGEFEYERLELSARELGPDPTLSVDVTVRNRGDRRSKEVVQIYVADREASVPRPARELRAFAALTLDPGEAGTATLELGPRAFSYWDSGRGGWYAEPGVFDILVGRSSRDIRLTGDVVLAPPVTTQREER